MKCNGNVVPFLQTVLVAVVDLQGTALLGGVNALHTSFPDDAEDEYKTQGSTSTPCAV